MACGCRKGRWTPPSATVASASKTTAETTEKTTRVRGPFNPLYRAPAPKPTDK